MDCTFRLLISWIALMKMKLPFLGRVMKLGIESLCTLPALLTLPKKYKQEKPELYQIIVQVEVVTVSEEDLHGTN